ncbi:MAG: glycosyltransferase family 1 protein [Acidobacteria bacterium]|jgi:glycosyltransferase involved in cell wall biosynthesis|nr:MAG: glycosyltransferase family 1 protein [Acidobacteriota bacterium]GIU81114.1 MAG: glycosyl transferase [Pyrinomonadaceae bacterium]
MRIVYAWNYLEWGGAQVYFLQLMKEAKKHHEVLAVMPEGSDLQLLKVLDELEVRCEMIKSHADTKPAFGVLRKIERHLNKLKSEFDFYRFLTKKVSEDTIFHVDFGVWQSFLFLWFLSGKAPVFFTIHNPVTGHQWWRDWLWKIKFRILGNRKNFHFFASNENAREFLAKYLPRKVLDTVKITYSGVDLEEISSVVGANFEEFYEKFGIPRDKFLVFCVGQFIDRKGRWEFLGAAEEVLDSSDSRDAFFVWLSNSKLSDEDRERIEKFRVGESFKLISSELIGDRRNYLRLLSLADLFVLPSHVEGLPIAVLEAMALGKAVVSTRINAIPEAVKHGETGWLIEPKNSEQLAQAIKALKADDSMRRKLGENARNFVQEKFDSKKIARIALLSYEEALLKR